MRALLLLLPLVALVAGQGAFLAFPDPAKCANRPKIWQFGNHNYFFSGDVQEFTEIKEGKRVPKKYNWLEARNLCREHCMDAVAMESEDENNFIFDKVKSNNWQYIWTSGRLCDFTGCEGRDDLKPLNVNGWFWSSTNTKMAPTNNTPRGWRYQPWSAKGHTGGPQPDNAEFDINNTTESCMGVLNNIYKDGIVWHDIACYHPKPVVCEDNDLLLNFVASQQRPNNGRPNNGRPNNVSNNNGNNNGNFRNNGRRNGNNFRG